MYESKKGRFFFSPDCDPLGRDIFLMINPLKSEMNLCTLCIKIQFVSPAEHKVLPLETTPH